MVHPDRGVRRQVRQALELAGYKVACAADSNAAERRFQSEQQVFQLVVLGTVLPDATGPELVEQLRAMDPDLRVIYLWNKQDVISIRGKADARSDALQLPFKGKELVDKAATLLRG